MLLACQPAGLKEKEGSLRLLDPDCLLHFNSTEPALCCEAASFLEVTYGRRP
jgi:hypothetical protein